MKNHAPFWPILVVTLILVSLASSLDSETLRPTQWVIYLIQYATVTFLGFRSKDRWLFALSPSFLTVSYMAANNVIGSFAYSHELVAPHRQLLDYWNWRHLSATTSFVLLANAVVMWPQFRRQFVGTPTIMASSQRPTYPGLEVAFSWIFFIGVLVAFSLIELDLSIFGGSGNFAIFPQTLAALGLAISLTKFKVRGRLFYYIAILLYFASFSSDDKRAAIFLIFPLTLIECLRLKSFRLNWRLLLSLSILSATSITLILMMSIRRGYGQFDPESFFDSIFYIKEYVQHSAFVPYLLNNLEINYIYFHLHQAIEYVIAEPRLLLLGTTFLKIFTIPIPRSIYPDKPPNIIDWYTAYHSPEFRAIGGSWPSTVYSEFFWNFHFMGLIPLFFVYWFATRWYFTLATKIRLGSDYRLLLGLYAYQQLLELIRGMGIDQYFVHLVVASALVFGLFLPVLWLIRQLGRPAPDSVRSKVGAAD